MPLRKGKVLVAEGTGPSVVLDEALWLEVEETYRRTLSASLRRLIEESTVGYVSRAHFEKNAAPAADANKHLVAIRNVAAGLIRELQTPGPKLDGRFYAVHLLRNKLEHPALPRDAVPPYRDPIRDLVGILRAVTAACDRSLEELDDPNYKVFEGEGWIWWIQALTGLLKKARLPTGARSHGDTSPFVRLVSRLQGALPGEYRRHTQSAPALAQAIRRALRPGPTSTKAA